MTPETQRKSREACCRVTVLTAVCLQRMAESPGRILMRSQRRQNILTAAMLRVIPETHQVKRTDMAIYPFSCDGKSLLHIRFFLAPDDSIFHSAGQAQYTCVPGSFVI